jgi:hypothetical protein
MAPSSVARSQCRTRSTATTTSWIAADGFGPAEQGQPLPRLDALGWNRAGDDVLAIDRPRDDLERPKQTLRQRRQYLARARRGGPGRRPLRGLRRDRERRIGHAHVGNGLRDALERSAAGYGEAEPCCEEDGAYGGGDGPKPSSPNNVIPNVFLQSWPVAWIVPDLRATAWSTRSATARLVLRAPATGGRPDRALPRSWRDLEPAPRCGRPRPRLSGFRVSPWTPRAGFVCHLVRHAPRDSCARQASSSSIGVEQ